MFTVSWLLHHRRGLKRHGIQCPARGRRKRHVSKCQFLVSFTSIDWRKVKHAWTHAIPAVVARKILYKTLFIVSKYIIWNGHEEVLVATEARSNGIGKRSSCWKHCVDQDLLLPLVLHERIRWPIRSFMPLLSVNCFIFSEDTVRLRPSVLLPSVPAAIILTSSRWCDHPLNHCTSPSYNPDIPPNCFFYQWEANCAKLSHHFIIIQCSSGSGQSTPPCFEANSFTSDFHHTGRPRLL